MNIYLMVISRFPCRVSKYPKNLDSTGYNNIHLTGDRAIYPYGLICSMFISNSQGFVIKNSGFSWKD